MQVKIAPSLMCADLLSLRADIEQLERARADVFHIDIMDGHFVPNIALSFDLTERISACTRVPLDLHLMVENPEDYIQLVKKVAPAYVSFHVESTAHPIRMIRALKSHGTQVGVALNPSTAADSLTYLIDELDFVLLMTVEPGFAGQKFIPQVLGKIQVVRQMLDARSPGRPIEVDGNLNAERAAQCIRNGASILVAGTSSVFIKGADVYTSCQQFREQLQRVI